MYKNKIIIATVLLFISFFLAFDFSSTKERANVMIVGTNAEFAPFTFRDNGQIVGFDIDIANEVCHRLGKEVDIKDMPFEALMAELSLGNVDFVAAGMSYTEERAKRVSFTKPYLNDDALVILTLKHEGENFKISLNDLIGKRIVVNEGYTADLFLSKKAGLDLIRLSTVADGFLALKSGRADAFVTAKSTIDSFLTTQDGNQYQSDIIEDTSENVALVVSKKYPKVLAEIQKALDEMEKDGTMDQFKTKWKLK